jgi:hypothetical protein
MLRKLTFVAFGLVLALGSACGSPTSNAGSSPTPEPSPSPVASPTQTAYDPCILVTAQEASTLTGVSYGPGREDVANALKECVYGYQTHDVFTVGVAQAPDLATAQAAEAQGEAMISEAVGKGVPVTHVQGIGDAAAEIHTTVSSGGLTLHIGAIYVLKGTTFFMIVDVSDTTPAPSITALRSEAMTVLGRL